MKFLAYARRDVQMQKPELFELVLLSVLDDWLALAATSTLIAFELKKWYTAWRSIVTTTQGIQLIYPTIAFRSMKLHDQSGWQRSHEWISSFRKNSRLCIKHLITWLLRRTLQAEILGFKPRSVLKHGAIPTHFFPWRLSKRPWLSSEKHSEGKLQSNKWLELLQTPKAVHHLCMTDKKIESWMLFGGNDDLYLKGVSPDQVPLRKIQFPQKSISSP